MKPSRLLTERVAQNDNLTPLMQPGKQRLQAPLIVRDDLLAAYADRMQSDQSIDSKKLRVAKGLQSTWTRSFQDSIMLIHRTQLEPRASLSRATNPSRTQETIDQRQ